MKVIVLFLISSVLTLSCYATCNNANAPSPPASAGSFLYKNDEYISNMSTIYHCNHCEPQCFINCEKTPSRCGSTELGCIRSILKNSSMENSTDYALDSDVSVEWIEPTPSLGNPQNLSSTNHQLCLCTGASQCNSSSEEGVYKCIIKGSNVTETLQFTYLVYKINSTSTCSGNNYITITSSSSSYRTFQVSKTITLLSTETTVIMAKTTETITTTMVNNSSSVTSFSLHSTTTCSSSSVNDQDSTIPYYGGIGLLAITNLLTLIVLVTSCVYIIHSKKQTKYALGRSRANVTVQSNPIGSLSVINIETEILNEDYDICVQQQQQQQQQQHESSHPSIDIYSYAVDDEDCTYPTNNNDNDEYATPDELFEVKRKGSNRPSVPPPYVGRGIDNVEERVNGVGTSGSADNLDCLYATIGSKEEKKEQTS